jgi:hypothetical protein
MNGPSGTELIARLNCLEATVNFLQSQIFILRGQISALEWKDPTPTDAQAAIDKKAVCSAVLGLQRLGSMTTLTRRQPWATRRTTDGSHRRRSFFA